MFWKNNKIEPSSGIESRGQQPRKKTNPFWSLPPNRLREKGGVGWGFGLPKGVMRASSGNGNTVSYS